MAKKERGDISALTEEQKETQRPKQVQSQINNAVKQLNVTLANGTREEVYNKLREVLRAQGQDSKQIEKHVLMVDATAHLAKTQGKKQTDSGSRELLARASELAMGMAGGENEAMYEKRLRKVLKAVGIKDKQQDQYVAKALKLVATKPKLEHRINVSDHIMRLASNDLALEKLQEREAVARKKMSNNSKDAPAMRAEKLTIGLDISPLLEAQKKLKKAEAVLLVREEAKPSIVRSGMTEMRELKEMISFALPESSDKQGERRDISDAIRGLSGAMPQKSSPIKESSTIKAGYGPEAAAEIARQAVRLREAGLKKGSTSNAAMSEQKRSGIGHGSSFV